MNDSEILDDEAKKIIRSVEILKKESELLHKVALELIEADSARFQYGNSRYLLAKSGLAYNLGYHIESENLDGSNRFRHSWSALSGDNEWQVISIMRELSQLLASEIAE